MKFTKTKVRHTSEEFDCPECGCPCYVGDDIVINDAWDVYCSPACAPKDVKPLAPRTGRDLALEFAGRAHSK